LSQQQKKPGTTRDISDLKQRLGLKKGPASRPTAGAPGGVVPPPPGVNVPPPPGARGPVLPSASDDPFHAMNVMATIGTLQQKAAGPEIIVVNDGRPVESVGTGTKIARVVKYAVLVIGPLVVGLIIGQIAKDAKIYNETIGKAAVVRDNVRVLKKSVNDVQNALLLGKERGFVANDKELTAALEAVTFPEVRLEDVYGTDLHRMNASLVSKVFEFYTSYAELSAKVSQHVKAAKNDEKAMTLGTESATKSGPPTEEENKYMTPDWPYRYGVYLYLPTKEEADKGATFGARFVEIGPPICEDRKASTTGKCPTAPLGYGFREAPRAEIGWSLMEFGAPGENVAVKKLIPLTQSASFDAIVKGGEPTAAELSYGRRVKELNDMITRMAELGSYIDGQLNSKANEKARFTFFL
jgi:hypothetical protein